MNTASTASGELTVRWLVNQRSLQLDLVVDPAGASFSVIHPCELEDPTQFVGEGAVLLLTAIAFRGRPAALAEYVRRVAAAGVRGIGLGLGIVVDEVPAEMVAAAREAGVALFTVPLPVPFVSILAAVDGERARRQERSRAQVVAAQEQFNQVAAREGLDRLLAVAAEALGAHLWLVDNDSRVASSARLPGGPAVDEAELTELVAGRGFGSAGRLGEAFVLAHRLGAQGERSHGLVAVSATPLDADRRALLRHCAGLAELIVARPESYRRVHRELNTLALNIQLGAAASPGKAELERVFAQVADAHGQVRPVVLAAQSARGLDRAISLLDAHLARLDRILFVAPLGDAGALVILRGSRDPASAAALFTGLGPAVRVAIGTPVDWRDLGTDAVAALQRVAFGLADGQVAGPEARTIPWLANTPVREALAGRYQETWGRLKRRDPELFHTLETYLRFGGQLTKTAAALATHRHTIAKRIQAVGEMFETDFSDPLVAADWLVVGLSGQGDAGGEGR